MWPGGCEGERAIGELDAAEPPNDPPPITGTAKDDTGADCGCATGADCGCACAGPAGCIVRQRSHPHAFCSGTHRRVQAQLGHSVHVFTPLKYLPGRDLTRVGTLVVTSLIALVSILTGYWLALPKRWRGAP